MVEQSVVAMISRGTCNILKEDVVFPSLLFRDSRYSQPYRRSSQVLPGLSLALPDRLLALPSDPKLVVRAPRCCQVHPKFSPALRGVLKLTTITLMVLRYQPSEIPVTPKASVTGVTTPIKDTSLLPKVL